LIDLIEDFLELEHPEDISSAAEKAKDKLQKFYPTSDGLVYIVATSMHINIYIYICLFIIIKYKMLIAINFNSHGPSSENAVLHRQ
jgi:hypothetical protein